MKTIIINNVYDLHNLHIGVDIVIEVQPASWLKHITFLKIIKDGLSYGIPWEIEADEENNTYIFKNNKAFQKLTGYTLLWAPFREDGVTIKSVNE
jgi:hypothetical protein